MEMDLGPLFGLWFQSLFIGITMWALYICIFIVIYGRMIEIYLVDFGGSRSNGCNDGKEWGGMGPIYLDLAGMGFMAFSLRWWPNYVCWLRSSLSEDDPLGNWSCWVTMYVLTPVNSGSLQLSLSGHYTEEVSIGYVRTQGLTKRQQGLFN